MRIFDNSTHLGAITLHNYIKYLVDVKVIEKPITKISHLQKYLTSKTSHELVADGWFGPKTYRALYDFVLRPKSYNFDGYYYDSVQQKKQIVWHHAAGRDSATGMFYWWKVDGRSHVATAVAIEDNGTVTRAYDESKWAHHLGVSRNQLIRKGISNFWTQNKILNKKSIAVEILNWGCLRKINGRYYPWIEWGKSNPNKNNAINPNKVIKLSYRGFDYYEKYTREEIKALMNWTILNAIRYNIPLDYSYDEFFNVSKNALKGKEGLYTHCSFRPDKTDVSPQGLLIEMAESLEKFQR